MQRFKVTARSPLEAEEIIMPAVGTSGTSATEDFDEAFGPKKQTKHAKYGKGERIHYGYMPLIMRTRTQVD